MRGVKQLTLCSLSSSLFSPSAASPPTGSAPHSLEPPTCLSPYLSVATRGSGGEGAGEVGTCCGVEKMGGIVDGGGGRGRRCWGTCRRCRSGPNLGLGPEPLPTPQLPHAQFQDEGLHLPPPI